MDAGTLASIIVPIIGTVLAVGFGLAALIMRSTARQDRRMDRFEDAMDTFRAGMRTSEREMLRLAERQSRVDGRLDERGSAAD